ncbi:M23 family metallopeptidase [Treponema ruminis]|uniref:Murein DD-endopeptidase MepM/ murein hydrolase activator NlpD n=1 Tax=Treponema ruminis TaxID=744515 RepID=A0A7W8G937_9SPIR|nr:M23 family metallopeptidase [Treponema ruminis]MBB5226095.1 murein DD-endopeptidase MepM/ murein hydrolase activator NlpD [Treponema ruminis]
MKKVFWGVRNTIKKMSVRNAAQCFFVTFGVCTLVLTGTMVFANHTSKSENNGQGGFESPTIPVTEEVLDGIAEAEAQGGESGAINAAFEDTYKLSYFAYRVRSGDMIGRIAEQFDITSDTIISVNNIRNSRLLQIGDYLKIPTMPGILYNVKKDGETIDSIAQKYKVDAVKCSAVNHIEIDSAISAGSTIFVPDAELDWVTRQEINGDLFRKPIRARWYKSSSFGWRASPFTGARSYHSGVDMACPTGTSIYAALPGKVTATGYNSTYGNYVIIAHHSGYKTLYGHMSAILCHKGNYVTQDTRIGRVGSTGMSTGPHLHFTVFKNNKQVNPENLWN